MNSSESRAWHAVCQIGDIPVGEGRMFAAAGTMVGLFNVGGQFFALANECPHAGASLAHGIVEGDIVRCRIHHWRFSVRDGTYLDEDKPQCNAQCIPVRIVADAIQVEVDSSEP